MGCDKAAPVAPEGATLTISASPSEITSVNGTSTITAVARRADGRPVLPGTEVRFDTTLGTIDSVVATDESGVARATLRGDGRLGTARVTASTGSVRTEPLEIAVGAAARTIVLQPTPTTIPANGGNVTLLAIVRDTRGQPLANQGVNFTTELGRLSSGGAIVQTNANGQARDTLRLSETDLANNPSNVTVTAQTAGGDGALISTSFEIQVQGDRPIAEFTYSRGATDLEVQFNDTSIFPGTVTYSWNFGDGTSSTARNPRHVYSAPGPYTVQLTITDPSGLSDSASARITVPVDQPGTSN